MIKPFIVLAYHNIIRTNNSFNSRLYISTKDFIEQIKFLKSKNYRFKYIDEVIDYNDIVITFDDGYENFTNIYDYIYKNKIKCELFISSTKKGSKIFEQDYGKYIDYLTEEEISKIYSDGIVKISNHGYSHLNFLLLSDIEIGKEIMTSNTLLNKNNIFTQNFCFPYGGYTNSSIDILKSKGYEVFYTTINGFNSNNKGIIKRFATRNLKELIGIIKKHDRFKSN